MVKEIGFGIIGCGIAAKWHVEAAMTGCGTRLVGVFDANADRAAEFASKYNCQAFLSAEELVASDDIDIVCICVPSGLHAKYSVMAANACKHIIVEKPLAMTVEQIEAVTSACERNKVQGTVISQLRFTPAVVAVKRAIDEGRLGRLILGDMKMKYYRSSEYYKSAAWRGRRDMDGGAVMNQGIHGIDLLLHLMGPISSVSGFSKTLIHDIESEDTACFAVEYASGAIGSITATTSLYPGYPRIIEISGTKYWNDNDDAAGLRPETVTVQLLRDGELIETVVIGAEDNWSYTFTDLPDNDGYGYYYTYTVTEQLVANYWLRVDGYDLYNTVIDEEPPTFNTFRRFREEELEELLTIFDYGVPLWGGLLGTGDEVPVYPFVFAGIGIAALVAFVVLNRKRRKA